MVLLIAANTTDESIRACGSIHPQNSLLLQAVRLDHEQLQFEVHLQVLEGNPQNIRHQIIDVCCLPPTTDGASEQANKSIEKIL